MDSSTIIAIAVLLPLVGWMMYALLNEMQWFRKSKIQQDHDQDRKISIFVNNLQRIDAWAELMKGIYKPQIFVIGAVLIIQAVVGIGVILVEWQGSTLAWIVGGINFFLCFMALIESIGRNRERNHYEKDNWRNYLNSEKIEEKKIENRNYGGYNENQQRDFVEHEYIKDAKATAEKNKYRLKGNNRWFTSMFIMPFFANAMLWANRIAKVIPLRMYKTRAAVILACEAVLALTFFAVFNAILLEAIPQIINSLNKSNKSEIIYNVVALGVLWIIGGFGVSSLRKQQNFLLSMRAIQVRLFHMETMPLEMNKINMAEKIAMQSKKNLEPLNESTQGVMFATEDPFPKLTALCLSLFFAALVSDPNTHWAISIPVYVMIGVFSLSLVTDFAMRLLAKLFGIRMKGDGRGGFVNIMERRKYEHHIYNPKAGKMHVMFPSLYRGGSYSGADIQAAKFENTLEFLNKHVDFDAKERIDIERMIKCAEKTGFEAADPKELQFMIRQRFEAG